MDHASILLVRTQSAPAAALLRQQLESLGHAVVGCAASDDEALAMALALKPDLLLLGSGLSGQPDIAETARWLRAQTGLPVILITDGGDLSALEMTARAHAFGCLAEPISAAQLQATIATALGHERDDLMETLARQIAASSMMGVVITKPEPPDYPIISVNAQFERITGYTAAEVIGRSPRFLHGKDTDPATLRHIKEAIERKKGCEAVLLNYRKDGSPFWNGFSLLPIHDATGAVTYFVGRVTNVSELVALKETLALSQAQLQEAQRIAHLGHWEWDLGTNAMHWSDEVYRIFGLQKNESTATYDAFLKWIHPDDRDRVVQSIQATIAGAGPFEIDHRIVWLDGRVRSVHAHGEVFRDASGRAVRLVGTVQDITERLQARTDLASTVAQLTATLEATADGILVVDRNNQIVRFNQRFVEMAGLTFEQQRIRDQRELRGLFFRELINPEETEARTRAVFENSTTDVRDQLEFKDGRVFERHSRPQRMGDEIVGRVISFRDITEQVRAKERLAGILELADDAIITVNAQQRIVFFNRGAERIFGYTSEEMLGQPLGGLLPQAFQAAHRGQVERFGAGAENTRPMGQRHVHIAGVRKNGEEFPAEASIARLRVGHEMFFTAILRDVTARRDAEQARERLEDQLRQSHKMQAIGTLAGGVAHDFNNILTAILGFASVASLDAPPGSPVHESLDEIQKAGQRASLLVKRILAFSRSEKPQREVTALQPVVQEVAALVRATLPASIAIDLALPKSAPAIFADTTQLHQVLLNLCTNARDAIGQRNGRITFRQTTAELAAGAAPPHPDLHPGSYVVLAVTDTGAGMDRATLERIFEPFYTTKGVGQGTGLGLSVVHGIMQSHDGAILVQSEPGCGTTFELYFPVHRGAATSAGRPAAEAAVPPADGHGRQILFVDDEESIVRLGEMFLERLGYRVTTFQDPLAALAAFRLNPHAYAAAVVDLTMPELNGLELTQKLLEIRPGLPVILATGFLGKLDPAQMRALGIREVLAKPTALESLGDALGRVLNAP
jgi:PAS domain S-box-containing protein